MRHRIRAPIQICRSGQTMIGTNMHPVILIVDDVMENIRLLKNLLQDIGQIVFARNGLEALAQAERHAPHIVLLDVIMPDMDGHETCRRLKANPHTAEIPVIFVTANDAESDEAQGLALGAIDYITKPYAPAVVRARVRNHLELVRAHSEVRQFKEKLEASERARRQWVADTSHELRTPITILNAHLEAIRDGVIQISDEEVSLLLETVRSMEKLVADLHDLARADAGAQAFYFAEVDLGAMLQEIRDGFAPQFARQSLECRFENLDCTVVLPADRQRLAQAVSNLLGNSLRYTDAGGQVLMALSEEGDAIVVRIEDSLPGVPDEALPMLFDRFYRVDGSRNRASGGSGLGLPICQAIVQAHGGQIAVRASELGGLCVEIRLPKTRSVA
jgi:signal transduction histidine kinase